MFLRRRDYALSPPPNGPQTLNRKLCIRRLSIPNTLKDKPYDHSKDLEKTQSSTPPTAVKEAEQRPFKDHYFSKRL